MSDKIDWTTLGGRVAFGDVAVGTSISTGSFSHPNFSTRRIFNSTYASTSSNGGITLQPGHYMVCFGGRITDGSGGNRWFAGLWNTATASNDDQSGFWFYSNLRYAWTGVIYVNISTAVTFKPSFYSQDVSGTINNTAWFIFYRSGDKIS